MSISGVNFSGLATGIDSESIIQATLKAERAPEAIWKNNITNLQTQQTAYNTVSAQLLSFQSTAQTLNALRSFDLVTGASSAADVATISVKTGAQTGDHSIVVTNLAQAQKLASAVQTSQTAPLGYTGQIIINGKAINVGANDSLQTLAGNINAALPGVNASIISPSANQYYLTLGSTHSGLQGQISLSDTAGGSFLSTLGVLGAGTSLRHDLGAAGAGSDLFADSATSVATLQGQTSIPPTQGTVSITSGGVTRSVLVDLSKSLSGIATDINAAFGSSVASVAAVTDSISGANRQQLQLSGVVGAGALVDDNHVLANLGLLQASAAAGSELQEARDAHFTIDTLPATRSSNTFSDAISGVTISLLKEGSGATTTLSVNSDTATIKSNIATFVKAFNDTIDTISSFSQFDPSTGKTGPLFGDSTTAAIVDSLVTRVTDQVSGLPSSLSIISQIGITLDQGNHLNIDDAALTDALANNLSGVAKLFRAAGVSTDPAIQFVSASGDTKPSGSAGYAVSITRPAQQAIITAGAVLVGTLAQDESITFTGALLGSIAGATSGYQLTLKQGSSLADIISQINADSKLGAVLSASNVGNKLTLTSKAYGSLAELAAISSIGSAGSSGIGTSLIDQKGIDVAGTINGETATGAGQFLVGSQQASGLALNGHALGLQIRVTATTAGNYGSISFTSGVANQVKSYVNVETDGFTGSLTTTVQGFKQDADSNQSNIDDLESRLKVTEARLRQQYAQLESIVSQIKSTSSSLLQIGSATK